VVCKIKNSIHLEILLKIAEIYRKAMSEEYKTLSELQWQQYMIIGEVMRTEDEKKIRMANTILSTLNKPKGVSI